jgi:hypothetical protein
MRRGCSIAIACSAIGLASPALAQGDSLGMRMSLGAAYDRQVAEGLPSLPESGLLGNDRSTSSATLAGSVDYARTRRSLGLTALASTRMQNNDVSDRVAMGRQDARVSASFRLPKRTTFTASQSAAYDPSYLDQLFPEDAPPAPGEGGDYQFSEGGSYTYRTNLSLTTGREIGTRLVTTADYGYQDVRQTTSTQPNVTTYGMGTRLYHTPTRRRSLYVGYQYRTGEFGSDGATIGHAVLLGAVYARPLSASRSLTFNLDVAPTMLDVADSAPAGTGDEQTVDQRLYLVQFNGGMSYAFHRNWSTGVNYSHSVDYLAGLREPTVSYRAQARLNGTLSRRVNLALSARYATSGSTTSGDATRLGTYTGEARLQFALGRSVGVYTGYLYSYYEDEAVGRPSVASRGAYEEHGIRVGITLSTQPFGG